MSNRLPWQQQRKKIRNPNDLNLRTPEEIWSSLFIAWWATIVTTVWPPDLFPGPLFCGPPGLTHDTSSYHCHLRAMNLMDSNDRNPEEKVVNPFKSPSSQSEPEPEREREKFSYYFPDDRAKPEITGYWQILIPSTLSEINALLTIS